MAGVEEILSIIKFCFFFGIAAVCVILITTAILRWINKEKKIRERNLNILAGVAIFVLLILFLIYSEGKKLPESKSFIGKAETTENVSAEEQSRGEGDEQQAEDNAENNEQNVDSLTVAATPPVINNSSDTLFFRVSVRAVKSLLFSIMVFSIIASLFMIIWAIKSGVSDILEINEDDDKNSENQETGPAKTAQDKKSKKTKCDALISNISKSTIAFTITCGLISLFFLIPFLVNEQTAEDPIESWIDGVSAISEVIYLPGENSCKNISHSVMSAINIAKDKDTVASGIMENELNDNAKTSNSIRTALISYILIYIICLGIGFTVVKILCAFIKHAFKKKENEDILDEYSSPIAFLAVGVSVLWLFQKKEFFIDTEEYTWIVELLKTYGMVIFVATITIITMEVVRLLMNIREKYIRIQAKCLFIFLIGECTLLLLDVLIFLHDVVGNAINGAVNDDLAPIKKKLKKKIVGSMETAINKSDKKSDDKEQDKMVKFSPQGKTISPFHEMVTKKKNVR